MEQEFNLAPFKKRLPEYLNHYYSAKLDKNDIQRWAGSLFPTQGLLSAEWGYCPGNMYDPGHMALRNEHCCAFNQRRDGTWWFRCNHCGKKGSILDLHGEVIGRDPMAPVTLATLSYVLGMDHYEVAVPESDWNFVNAFVRDLKEHRRRYMISRQIESDYPDDAPQVMGYYWFRDLREEWGVPQPGMHEFPGVCVMQMRHNHAADEHVGTSLHNDYVVTDSVKDLKVLIKILMYEGIQAQAIVRTENNLPGVVAAMEQYEIDYFKDYNDLYKFTKESFNLTNLAVDSGDIACLLAP